MAWIDTDYVDNFIGQTQREKLFANTAGTFTQATFDQFEASARARVVAVALYAGYALSSTVDSTTDAGAFLQGLAAAVMVRDAYGMRKGIRLAPETAESIAASLGMLDAVYNKQLPIPGMEPAAKDGYGGVQFSPTTGTGARPGVFTALRGTGF